MTKQAQRLASYLRKRGLHCKFKNAGTTGYWSIDFANGVEMVKTVLPEFVLDAQFEKTSAGTYKVTIPALKITGYLTEWTRGSMGSTLVGGDYVES